MSGNSPGIDTPTVRQRHLPDPGAVLHPRRIHQAPNLIRHPTALVLGLLPKADRRYLPFFQSAPAPGEAVARRWIWNGRISVHSRPRMELLMYIEMMVRREIVEKYEKGMGYYRSILNIL